MSNSDGTLSNYPGSLVEKLARYVDTGEMHPSLGLSEHLIEPIQLRRICIGLLSWLKSRERFPRMDSVKLSKFGSAETALPKFLSMGSPMSDAFVILDGAIRLNTALTDAQAAELIAAAGRMYNPPRFSTVRTTQST